MDSSTIMGYGGIAACLAGFNCALFALLRALGVKNSRNVFSVLFSVLSSAHMAFWFGLYGWESLEIRESFFENYRTLFGAKQQQAMACFVLLQLLVLVLACAAFLRGRAGRGTAVLLAVTAVLTVGLLIGNWVYFTYVFPVFTPVISVPSNLLLLLLLYDDACRKYPLPSGIWPALVYLGVSALSFFLWADFEHGVYWPKLMYELSPLLFGALYAAKCAWAKRKAVVLPPDEAQEEG